jgi:glycosyltransferase involved in cell wall biosynthesis
MRFRSAPLDMKILYLITCAAQGGAQVNVLSLAREAAARGHSVRIATGEVGWLTERTAGCGGKTVILRGLRRSWNPRLMLRFVFALRRELQREPADIVHLHSSNALFGVLAAKTVRHSPKLIATVHGLSVSNLGWRRNRAMQWAYTRVMCLFWGLCDRLIFVCQNDLDLATERRWVKAERCSVVANGIGDGIEFLGRERARGELGLAADDRRPVIGTVTRLEYSKDLDLFLRVAKEMRGSGAVFQIIGDGPDRQRLQGSIARLGLADSGAVRRRA